MNLTRITQLSLFVTLVTTATFISCKKPSASPSSEAGILEQTPALPAQPFDYDKKHHVNSNLATLGRVLFYDKNLSLNNSTSCGSCHKQEFAFADNVKFNKGFNGLELTRNSPSIQGIRGFKDNFFEMQNNGRLPVDGNLGNAPTKENQVQSSLFWDGRQTNVADMVLNPVLNHKEMNMPDFETLIKKLNSIAYYPPLFKKAYGEENITKERIAFAMQSFMACLNTTDFMKLSGNTQKTNDVIRVPELSFPIPSTLTPIQQKGLILFHTKYNCASCHKPTTDPALPPPPPGGGYGGAGSGNMQMNMTTFPGPNEAPKAELLNIGLDEIPRDKGRGAITGMPGDVGLFKVPTLNNISVTGPYMHDGRYATLDDVLEHYSHNIKNSSTLAPQFRNLDGTVKTLNISGAEKKALIAFLNTLKDEDFLTSPMYSNPFN